MEWVLNSSPKVILRLSKKKSKMYKIEKHFSFIIRRIKTRVAFFANDSPTLALNVSLFNT